MWGREGALGQQGNTSAQTYFWSCETEFEQVLQSCMISWQLFEQYRWQALASGYLSAPLSCLSSPVLSWRLPANWHVKQSCKCPLPHLLQVSASHCPTWGLFSLLMLLMKLKWLQPESFHFLPLGWLLQSWQRQHPVPEPLWMGTLRGGDKVMLRALCSPSTIRVLTA